MDREIYSSPLSGRYASKEMLKLFSERCRIETFRELWVALADGERTLGLPVTKAQVDELRAHVSDIDWDLALEKEREIRHDVMAHIHAYGEVCPGARPIIHLGATSCYVTDNADMIIYRRALKLLADKLVLAISNLREFALEHKSLACLGYTHLQVAQPVTLGKRACLYIQDLLSDLNDLEHVSGSLKLLGSKGTTGTQASFLALFDGDHAKVKALDRAIAEAFGFDGTYEVTGQTYPRKEDSRMLSALSAIAQSAYRFANDLRILQGFRELEEPFEAHQVGSSAMAYKRNPMRSERICSLARYVIADSMNPAMTASTQWLERTLDDSANRRIAMPEAFLAVDAILELMINVTRGMIVHKGVISQRLDQYMPYIATEDILMAAVERGGDRQELHERIRMHSMEATKRMLDGDGQCDLLARLAGDSAIAMSEDVLKRVTQPQRYVGRCAQQVEEFIAGRVDPALESHPICAHAAHDIL